MLRILKRLFAPQRSAGGSDRGLDLRSGNASKNDVVYGATAAQGSARPDDYPEEKRAMQVSAATGERPGSE